MPSTIKPAGSLPTRWAIATYDVWGSAKNGWDVNDVYRGSEIELRVPQWRYNCGTPQEFIGAAPSDKQIKAVFGVRCHIETDGDDLNIYVNRDRDGYPIGEMRCVSHESLSPVRKGDPK